MWKKICEFGDYCSSKWEQFVSWCGGKPESRNLLGVFLDVSAAVIKMPFKLAWTTGKVCVLLAKSPKEGFDYLRYLGHRFAVTFAAMVGIARGKYGWDMQPRFAFFLYTWLFSSIFAGISVWFTIIPLAIWFGTGIRPAFIMWRMTKFDDWRAEAESVDLAQRVIVAKRGAEAAASIERDRHSLVEYQALQAELAELRAQQATTHKRIVGEHDTSVERTESKKEGKIRGQVAINTDLTRGELVLEV